MLSLLFFLTVTSYSQVEEQPEEKATDSISNALSTDVLIMDDSLTIKKSRNINPLAPSKAAFYSAVLPGLGQIYNKRYWKVPLVWGAIGGSVYAYTWNNDNYKRFRTAFKRRQAGFTDDEFNGEGIFPLLDDGDLENQQERFQRDRDLWLVLSIVAYSLNIIDANVDAHLKQFNIDNNLALDFEPYLDLNAVTNNPTYGMALTIKF
ncbi:hypothetical protein FEK29_15850 [Maribacter aurantiacus]|uniref:DUF5683 domain-containing protein n=1 Tax=Maribacter aurantiacus TaxID=1882343 RepID=A0A5R8LYA0_9FLAO|nr:hypothetical protein FEK29_15850 [Maribacter aurantiacus]